MGRSNISFEKVFDADGNSEAFNIYGSVPLSINGLTAAGAGTVTVQRSTDDGLNFGPVKLPDFTDAAFTADAEFTVNEAQPVKYRFVMSSYSSGDIACRAGIKYAG